jgi:hypothetical protein
VTEEYRFNRHVWDIEPKYFPIQRKFVMANYCVFTLASGLIKLSVLLFYRRLSSRAVSPIFRWVMRIMMVIIACYTAAFIIVLVFSCRPFSAWWEQVDFAKKLSGTYRYNCLDEGADVVANGIISTVQDFIVAFLPTLLCWKLQMPLRQKVALYGIFAISYSTVAIGAMRTYSSYRIYFVTYDVTWAANDAFMWSLLELHIGAMCANAPALRVFFNHLLQSERMTKLMGSYSSKSRSKVSTPQQRSTDANTTNVSTSSAWVTIAFWKSSQSRGSSGYMSETNTNFEVDKHGGIVRTKADGRYEEDQRDSYSTSKPFAPEYEDTIVPSYGRGHDVEMGILPAPTRDNRNSEIQALPPVRPTSTTSWLKPIRALSPFPKL